MKPEWQLEKQRKTSTTYVREHRGNTGTDVKSSISQPEPCDLPQVLQSVQNHDNFPGLNSSFLTVLLISAFPNKVSLNAREETGFQRNRGLYEEKNMKKQHPYSQFPDNSNKTTLNHRASSSQFTCFCTPP